MDVVGVGLLLGVGFVLGGGEWHNISGPHGKVRKAQLRERNCPSLFLPPFPPLGLPCPDACPFAPLLNLYLHASTERLLPQ